ncbi:MAG: hypothetical protein ACI9YH_000924 [Colwellia sp.]|jgi:hypothetical protein
MKKQNTKFAQYRIPTLEVHQKNPLICALPSFVKPSRLRAITDKMPKLPDLEYLDKNDRITLAKRARKIRVATKFFIDFYHEVYNLIVIGYEERNPMNSEVIEFHYDVADPSIDVEELIETGIISETDEDTTCEHMILTGISGMGKSALKNSILKQLIPRTKIHTLDYFDEIQVFQLHAEMPHDGTRGTLLKNLFEGLDEALKGFEKTNYLEMVQPKLDRSVNIGAMEKFFKSLCIKYHVGIIIIDEFQNIDVANKDDKAKMRQLFDSMSNKLHVPFLKVGTTDSFGMMKAKFQHGRRAGDTIELLPYSRVPEIHNKSGIDKGSANGNDWKLLMKAVFDFQVIKKPIKYSTRWDEELYKLSCGIPYVLFTLWHEAQVNAIRTGSETLTFKQLNDVYRQRFKLIKAAITALRTERIGQFSDLLCIAQLFDKNEVDAAIKRLNHFVNKENFSGAAAADVLQSVEDIEKENTLKEPQKRKLAQIKSELKQRAATIKKGQVYDNQA